MDQQLTLTSTAALHAISLSVLRSFAGTGSMWDVECPTVAQCCTSCYKLDEVQWAVLSELALWMQGETFNVCDLIIRFHGVIIILNDGWWANQCTHPCCHVVQVRCVSGLLFGDRCVSSSYAEDPFAGHSGLYCGDFQQCLGSNLKPLNPLIYTPHLNDMTARVSTLTL